MRGLAEVHVETANTANIYLAPQLRWRFLVRTAHVSGDTLAPACGQVLVQVKKATSTRRRVMSEICVFSCRNKLCAG
jgi:hypothetical protein